jgi:DNA invertase Pin-like site-specific DNA recombinase
VSAKISDELREKRREAGRIGGKIGGKRRLVTMTKAKRVHLAYIAGLQGGAPVRIDHEQVRALREQGLKYREIAKQMKISIPSVARILGAQPKAKR